PREPLAMYLAHHFDTQRKGMQTALGELAGSPQGFVQRLARFRDLYLSWKNGQALKGDAADRLKAMERALQSLGEAPTPIVDGALLMVVYGQAGPGAAGLNKGLGEAGRAFVGDNQLGYTLRYEIARGWWRDGNAKAAHKEFCELYLDRLEGGSIPPVDP